MLRFYTITTLFLIIFLKGTAQYDAVNIIKTGPVDVRIEYAYGNSIFSAHNNASYPVFLHVHFKEVSKLSFFEKQPYVKCLKAGFNELFVLEKSREHGLPKYDYTIRYYPSNPFAIVDLDFPYLLPFEAGTVAIPKKVLSLEGFITEYSLYGWSANGFNAQPKQIITACRTGTVIEIINENIKDSILMSNVVKSRITLLHTDGTLASYIGVVSNDEIELSERITAGNSVGQMESDNNELIVLFYKNRPFSDELEFIFPKFQLSEGVVKPMVYEKKYTVVHPVSTLGLELTKREKKKILGINP